MNIGTVTNVMRLSPIAVLVTLVLGACAVTTCWAWLSGAPSKGVSERGPFPAHEIPRFRPKLPGELTVSDGVPLKGVPGSWPRFRGPYGDGVSDEEIALADRWPEAGPRALWTVDLGEGYAGMAINKGRVYVMDYDEGRIDGKVIPERRGDALRCLSLADGKEIWRRWYHLPMVRYHGITRTVPAVTDTHVVSLGPLGHVLCVDAMSGEALWSRDLVEEFGTVIPEWYAGQCPRIDVIDGKEVAILAPGGDQGVLMLAVECESGKELWRTPNPKKLQMTHSSIVGMEWQGMATYVYCTTGGVVGVKASDGSLLWEYPDWRISPAIVPTPVILDDNRILLSGGYKAGSVILEIRENEKHAPVAAVITRLDVRTFCTEQQTPIYYDDCIYGVLTKNAGPRREQLVCMSSQGAVLWSSGPEHLFELGSYMVADGKLLILNDSGVLTMLRPSASGYEELASARVLQGRESWAPMAIAGGRLLVRDLKTLVCLDLRSSSSK